MVAVAQLVESRIVIPVVVGSSPISHPTELAGKLKGYMLRLVTLFLYFPTVFQTFQRAPATFILPLRLRSVPLPRK